MYGKFQEHLQGQLNEIEQNGLFKKERVITNSSMDAVVK
jgi:glycine C-acetyltransferase